MRICDEARDYATAENAKKALVKALARIGWGLDDVRYMIVVNSVGRFVPAVVPTDVQMASVLRLVRLGVAVVR